MGTGSPNVEGCMADGVAEELKVASGGGDEGMAGFSGVCKR